jgi:hypothetical protein
MKYLRQLLVIVLIIVSLCKLGLMILGYPSTLSKSKFIELILPLILVYLISVRNRYTWILLVLLLLYGTLELHFLYTKSSFFPIFKLINPVLELMKLNGINGSAYRFLFYLPDLLIPIAFLFMLTKYTRRLYRINKVSS